MAEPAPILRLARPADRLALIELLEESYASTWAPHVGAAAWARWSAQQRPMNYVQAMSEEFIVADIAGETAGMVHWREDVVQALHVSGKFRRQGVGSTLLRHAESAIAKAGYASVRLETDSFNTTSRAFYLAHGYREVDSRDDDEWSCGLVTLLLTKPLVQPPACGSVFG